jgi:hypothetical protein
VDSIQRIASDEQARATPSDLSAITSHPAEELAPVPVKRRRIWFVASVLAILLLAGLAFVVSGRTKGNAANVASQALLPNSLKQLEPIKIQPLLSTYTFGGDVVITGNISASNFKGVSSGSGSVGPAGPQGLQGARGLTGLQGPAGAAGATGAAGVAGATGATGPQGPAGPSTAATCAAGACLSLQAASPGLTETGSLNISGTGLFGSSIGIGTTAPAGALHVAGAVSIFGAGEGGVPAAAQIRGAAAAGTDVAGADFTFDASNGTGAGGSGALIFRTAAPPAPPAFDAATSISGGVFGSTTGTFNHQVSLEPNRLLLVQVSELSGQTVSAVSYNGVALTKLDEQVCPANNFAASCRASLWYMLAPPSGTHPVVVTFSAVTVFAISAVSYFGVDQAAPFGTVVKSSGSVGGGTNPVSLSVASNARQTIFYGLGSNNGVAFPTARQRTLVNSGTFERGATQDTPGVAPQVAEGWSMDSADYAIIAVPLNQPTGSAPDAMTDRLHISNSGAVGIGIPTPTATLHVAGPVQSVSGQDANAALLVTGGEGGSAGAGQTGGHGGALSQTAGPGGRATDVAGIPGVGGSLQLEGGTGGAGLGTGANGSGGDVFVQGGAAGTGGSGAAGSTGIVHLQNAGGSVEIGSLTTQDATARLVIGTQSTAAKGLVIQAVAGQSADLLQAQDSTGSVLSRLSADGSLTVANAVVSGNLTMSGHLITAGSPPTIAAGAAAGTGATVSISGNDLSGMITITTGTGAGSGVLATATFASSYGAAPNVTLTANNSAAALLPNFATSTSTTLSLHAAAAASSGTTYIYFYHVEQ